MFEIFIQFMLQHQLFTYLTITLTFLGFMARLRPALGGWVMVLQTAAFLVQLANQYYKNRPAKHKQVVGFVADASLHYLKTHPEGQRIAQETGLDEKMEALAIEVGLFHDDDADGIG